jgi:hypothetical protein
MVACAWVYDVPVAYAIHLEILLGVACDGERGVL